MDFSDSKQKLECVVTYILQINVSLHTCVDTLSWDICSRSKKVALSLWYVMFFFINYFLTPFLPLTGLHPVEPV